MKYVVNCFIALMICLSPGKSLGQIETLLFDDPVSFTVKGITLSGKKVVTFPYGQPLFTLLVDSNFYSSYCAKSTFSKSGVQLTVADSIAVFCRQEKKFSPGIKYIVRFTNNGKINHTLQNLVPLGETPDKVYITASGSKAWPEYLCRTKIFRQGHGPVGVVMPDNAWHAGFSDLTINDTISIAGLARRGERDKEKSEIDRWSVTLKPGGWIEYTVYFDVHRKGWHEGLRMMFQDRWLYDLPAFDESLYKRSDLGWMKNKYLILLQFAWDKKYFDYNEQRFTFYRDFFAYDSLTGGFDIYALWPTWPRLGLDQRNQWDMYRDLPGGIKELRKQVDFIHKKGRKYFISYNPWDEGTRSEDQMKGMETLLRATDADGVVLDTRGASSLELQATADKVKPGIIMYSEGMAVPKDMPGIVSGRVHDAIVMPPPLNLNKLIKPDFAIFRVLQLADDRLHREIAIAFFNGYGIEINTMRPGRPVWMEEEFKYLGRTTRLLRENNSVFHNDNFIPLIETLSDSIYVNQWSSGEKTIFTIYSLKPQGWFAPLYSTGDIGNRHLVDLWNHEDIMAVMEKCSSLVTVKIDGFDPKWLGTRREGNVGCVAVFPKLLHVKTTPDTIYFKADAGKTIVITGRNPDYQSKRYTFSAKGNEIPFWDYFPETTEKIVIQLFDDDELLDERGFFPKHNIPRNISRVEKTEIPKGLLTGMSLIPAGPFRFYTARAPGTIDPFIPFPDYSDTVTIQMNKFYMDEYPVTNQQFRFFLKKSGYVPRDTTNFLKHWQNNAPAEGEADFPVVYVSPEDARAYAKWIGRRLPTEKEWQYAAQGTNMRKYPWGDEMDSTKCNYNSGKPQTIYQHPEGASPFGVKDMIGNVWQMTNDVYFNSAYYYNIIRGGSYYHPTSSIWYVTGGAVPADHPEMLLLISPALNRNATVGFRCVKDAE